MPRHPRPSTAGLVFHVLNRAAKRAVLFENKGDYAAFERVLEAAVDRGGMALFAYCVMPNHWHLLLSPQANGALSRFMHWLTTTHARRWQTAHDADGHGAVYQGRFKAIPIEHDDHFLWVCRYIERNPLRASLVERAEDWNWSSLRFREDPRPAWLTQWPVARPPDWLSQVNTPQTQAELDAFRDAMRKEQPYGKDGWKRQVMARIGVTPNKQRGRPRKTAGANCPQKMTSDPIYRFT